MSREIIPGSSSGERDSESISNSPKISSALGRLPISIPASKPSVTVDASWTMTRIKESICPLFNRFHLGSRSVHASPTKTSVSIDEASQSNLKQPILKPISPSKSQMITQRRSLHSTHATNDAGPSVSPSVQQNLHLSYQKPDLIGDYSRPHILPYLVFGQQHPDLKCLSFDVVAELLKGKYRHAVSSYEVVDCRFPYEYDGGHIRGAKNYYTRVMISDRLLKEAAQEDDKPQVIVFYCEFSSKRAPSLMRYLRTEDRAQNQERYPRLYYPEIYVLQGGYKSFFETYPKLCLPRNYIKMIDPAHKFELSYFSQHMNKSRK